MTPLQGAAVRHCLALLQALLLISPLGAAASPAVSGPCDAAIAAAEVAQGIPTGLLAAIARVESGGATQSPWPWTINANGDGRRFATSAEAISAVTALRSLGVASIDVGCLQVNLAQHPGAFRDLTEAFAPIANARYAARFLVRLAGEMGGWTLAVGAYHSHVGTLADPYAAKVMAAWTLAPPAPSVAPAISWSADPPDWLRLARGGARPSLPAPSLRWPASGACRWRAFDGCDQSPFATASMLRRALAPPAVAVE